MEPEVDGVKITIAYIDGEEREADVIQRFANRLLGGAKVRKSDRNPPWKHIYLTTKATDKGCDSNKNTCTTPPSYEYRPWG